jgi:UDP-N-acetylmuramyl pentapeptide phosphotransferase/UDP-N-acetylglucosamine-1-phosphate transferase
MPLQISTIDIPYLDSIFLIPGFGFLLTIFAITGLSNAYNIIDGSNGLASMVGMITLLAISYVGFKLNDPIILQVCLIAIGSILGFFIWNYPKGLIFLGDGGAYLIGFYISCITILLINRHPEISPWFGVVVNGYPILETMFTIYRRRIHQGKNPSSADGIHFHTLIYRRILKLRLIQSDEFSANSRTAPYLWFLTILSATPAIFWWHSSAILVFTFILFSAFYIWLYSRMVRLKTPKWLHFL